MNLSDIGQIIQQRRKQVGLSQAQLAAMGHLSRATVNQLENVGLTDLEAAKLFALTNLLGKQAWKTLAHFAEQLGRHEESGHEQFIDRFHTSPSARWTVAGTSAICTGAAG